MADWFERAELIADRKDAVDEAREEVRQRILALKRGLQAVEEAKWDELEEEVRALEANSQGHRHYERLAWIVSEQEVIQARIDLLEEECLALAAAPRLSSFEALPNLQNLPVDAEANSGDDLSPEIQTRVDAMRSGHQHLIAGMSDAEVAGWIVQTWAALGAESLDQDEALAAKHSEVLEQEEMYRDLEDEGRVLMRLGGFKAYGSRLEKIVVEQDEIRRGIDRLTAEWQEIATRPAAEFPPPKGFRVSKALGGCAEFTPDRAGHVYLVVDQGGDFSRMLIGMAKDPDMRLATFKMFNPMIAMIRVVETADMRDLERTLRAYFDSARTDGEWLAIEESDFDDAIERLQVSRPELF